MGRGKGRDRWNQYKKVTPQKGVYYRIAPTALMVGGIGSCGCTWSVSLPLLRYLFAFI